MHVCFCCVCFSFSVLSQQIGWEERPRNDLFCVKWDVKPQLNQSVMILKSFHSLHIIPVVMVMMMMMMMMIMMM